MKQLSNNNPIWLNAEWYESFLKECEEAAMKLFFAEENLDIVKTTIENNKEMEKDETEVYVWHLKGGIDETTHKTIK